MCNKEKRKYLINKLNWTRGRKKGYFLFAIEKRLKWGSGVQIKVAVEQILFSQTTIDLKYHLC